MKTQEELEALVRGLGARAMRAVERRDRVIAEDSIIARDIVRFFLDVPADIEAEKVLHGELMNCLLEGKTLTEDRYQKIRDQAKQVGLL